VAGAFAKAHKCMRLVSVFAAAGGRSAPTIAPMQTLSALPPPLRRRAIGGVYLVYFVVAFLGAGIKSHAVIVVSDVIYVVLTLLFFVLLRNVNVVVAIAATACSLAGQVLAVFFNQGAAGLVVDGLFLILLGFLWWRSGLIPRALAAFVAIAGLAWLTFALPARPAFLIVPVEVVGGVAELSLMLWLLIRGVDVERGPRKITAAQQAPA
jgi:hypothetical protein